METIQTLINQRYLLFNVNTDKKPMGKGGVPLTGWQQIGFEESLQNHDMTSRFWGIKTGEHPNGRLLLSLDFDVKKGVKTGEVTNITTCPIADAKLKEYLALGIMDGMFRSSTDGNRNVLVDYTDCPELITAFGERSKVSIGGLEMTFGSKHQQVIPPTKTKCKVHHEPIFARKWLSDTPILRLTPDHPVSGFILETFKDKFKGAKKVTVTPKTPREELIQPPTEMDRAIIEEDPNQPPTEMDRAIIEEDPNLTLLFDVIGNGTGPNGKIIDWDTWNTICWTLKTNGYKFEIFQAYSAPHDIQKKAEERWNSKSSNQASIHNLKTIAARINPDGYREWQTKNANYIPINVLTKGENDWCKYIAPTLSERMVYSNRQWWVFNEATKLWYVSPDPRAISISHLQKMITCSLDYQNTKLRQATVSKADEADIKAIVDTIKCYTGYYLTVGNSQYSSQTIKILQTYLLDNDFMEKLNNTRFMVAFRNGILDLRSGRFREGIHSSDYLTKTIPFDYETADERDVEYVREQIKKICNYNDEHLDYYLSILGYAMTGASDLYQEFYFIRGQKASNGKSKLLETLSTIMPNYVSKADPAAFNRKAEQRHKSVAEWSGVRILWGNELDDKELDPALIKQVADGESVNYKIMYGTTANMPISFKLFLVSNHTIQYTGDAGMNRRIRLLQFDSEFREDISEDDFENRRFVRNESFGREMAGKYRAALVGLIMEAAHRFCVRGSRLPPLPKEWEDETRDLISETNAFQSWFLDQFEIGKEYRIGRETLQRILKEFKGAVKFKDEVKKNHWGFHYDCNQRFPGSRVKGVWSGFRPVGWEDEEEDSDGGEDKSNISIE